MVLMLVTVLKSIVDNIGFVYSPTINIYKVDTYVPSALINEIHI